MDYLGTLHKAGVVNIEMECSAMAALCHKVGWAGGLVGVGEEVHVRRGSDSTYGVILRIVKAGGHPVAIAQVVEH